MHVFRLSEKRLRRGRNILIAQLVLASIALSIVILVLLLDSYRALGENHASRAIQLFCTVVGFLAAAYGFGDYFRGHRGRIRVVINPRTLALKTGRHAIRFLKKEDFVGFNPVRHAFTLRDRSELALADTKLPLRDIQSLTAFIFGHWWPGLSCDAIRFELEQELPMPQGRIQLLLFVVVLAFGVTYPFVFLIVYGLHVGIAFGVIGGMIVLLLSVSRIPAQIKERERERNAYMYLLPDAGVRPDRSSSSFPEIVEEI